MNFGLRLKVALRGFAIPAKRRVLGSEVTALQWDSFRGCRCKHGIGYMLPNP
jgi:hypothetical protein